MSLYSDHYAAIMADPATSDWLKLQARRLHQRDPVDAIRDAKTLLILAEMRMSDVKREAMAIIRKGAQS